jgi:hypothetical protein
VIIDASLHICFVSLTAKPAGHWNNPKQLGASLRATYNNSNLGQVIEGGSSLQVGLLRFVFDFRLLDLISCMIL